jgi:formate hydrogenlyase transcriptional activator
VKSSCAAIPGTLLESEFFVPEMVRHFLVEFSARQQKQVDVVPPELMRALVAHEWPGNVRELRNFIARAVVFSPGPVLAPPRTDLQQVQKTLPQGSATTLAEAVRVHILEALEQSRLVLGGRDGAAERLGLPRTTLVYKMSNLWNSSRAATTNRRNRNR